VTEKKRSRKNDERNYRLKLERERRGWSLGYVATLIGCPDPHTVSRWERQIFYPSPRYRQALCELYGKDAQELGFLKEELRQEPEERSTQVHEKEPSPIYSPSYFCFNMKLPHADELYGRKIERDILLNRILHKSSTSLVGPRRIGKTWLLEYLLLEARKQLGNHLRIGYLDGMMASCSTMAGFTAKAARTLGSPLSYERASEGLAALEDVVETLRSKGLSSVLCIDEFEYMSGMQEFDLNFFASLRALAQGGLSLVVASKRPLIDIVGHCGDESGFFNIFEQITVKPFSNEEAETFVMAKTACAHFTDRERAMLLKYGQLGDGEWPPTRLQLVAKMLFEDKILKGKEDLQCGRPDDIDYWQCFEQRLEEKYRGVILR
jgi:transcriptional regulator with XRE-family HTH domain